MINKIVCILGFLSISNLIAATTGSITLKGVSAKKVSIVVSPEAGYDSLNLYNSYTDLKVATVKERSNVQNGYSVSLSSANAGSLKNGTFPQAISYSAKYNGVAVILSSTAQTITDQSSQAGIINIDKNFTISYTGVAQDDLMEGEYSDTLTFTISAK